jgi:hypothetical protein
MNWDPAPFCPTAHAARFAAGGVGCLGPTITLACAPSAAASAAFVDKLLGPERRKTGWTRAEAAGDLGP